RQTNFLPSRARMELFKRPARACGTVQIPAINVMLKDKMNVIACAVVQIFVLAAGGLIMKGRRALLFTSDTEFESVVRQALLGTDTIFLIARTVSDALQIACQRGRE